MPNDLTPEPPATPVERIEFIKCETSWCRSNIGIRLPSGKVFTNVPATIDLYGRTIEIPCPYCKAVRVWKARALR